MARARAPGKVVLSGAYSVLEGGPALVSAVDRWVIADTARPPEHRAAEVLAVVSAELVPHVDVSALRHEEQKLGLGSSAAIVVASLAALVLGGAELPAADLAAIHLDPGIAASALARAVLPRALEAHHRAQGGGSGIDVAASALGGALACRRVDGVLQLWRAELPPLHFELWFSRSPASTPELLGRVRALAARDPSAAARWLGAQREASERALAAQTPREFVAALAAQRVALQGLGDAAGAPIVTPEVRALAELAEGAAVLPAGAGGGDVVLYAGVDPPSAPLEARRAALGWLAPGIVLGAGGVEPA